MLQQRNQSSIRGAEVWLPKSSSASKVTPVLVEKQGHKDSALDNNLSLEIQKRLLRVRLFLSQGACREASLDLMNLLNEKPNLAIAHYLLGATLMCRKLYPEALKAYSKAIDLDSKYQNDARILEDAQLLLKSTKMSMAVVDFFAMKMKSAGIAHLATSRQYHKQSTITSSGNRISRLVFGQG